MHFDPELNVYTSESPEGRLREQRDYAAKLEKRVSDLEKTVAHLKAIVEDLPPRRSGSLKR